MIDTFTRQWNEGSSPFAWVRTADEILAKAVRKPRAIKVVAMAPEVLPKTRALRPRAVTAKSSAKAVHG